MAGETKRVKVLRGFYEGYKIHAQGAVVEIPALLAREVIASNKAELTEAPLAEAPPPAPKKTKGGKDAG